MVQASSPSLVTHAPLTQPAETTPARLLSLDAFRGATIALMILVNTPGGPNAYGPLNHSEWNGWTITDTVFPSFLWIVGVAITLSLGKRIAAGVPKSRLFLQVLRRAAVIFGLGLIVYAAPDFNLSTQRLLGVLQRIAICYLIASAIYLTTRWRVQVVSLSLIHICFPTRRHIPRRAQIDRVIPITRERPGLNQASRYTGLEQFAVPLLVSRARQDARVAARDHFAHGFLHFPESLPVAARRQCITALAVVVVMIQVPVSPLHSLDQRCRDAVPLSLIHI